MRYFLFTALLLFGFLSVYARGNYIYQDRNVSITVEWKDNGGSETITVKLKPLIAVLIPSEKSCFYLDTTASVKCSFDNIGCPVYVNGEPLYIIDDHVNNKYYLVPKDTVLIYKWQALNSNKPTSFSFDIVYIATDTKEYAAKKKHFGQISSSSGDIVLSITPEDEDILRSKAHLEITEQ